MSFLSNNLKTTKIEDYPKCKSYLPIRESGNFLFTSWNLSQQLLFQFKSRASLVRFALCARPT